MTDKIDNFGLNDESLYDKDNSKWGKPQGLYMNDVDARVRLVKFFRRFLAISQAITLFLALVIFIGVITLIFFTNYESVIMDDGSQLFCTLDKDGTVAIAY